MGIKSSILAVSAVVAGLTGALVVSAVAQTMADPDARLMRPYSERNGAEGGDMHDGGRITHITAKQSATTQNCISSQIVRSEIINDHTLKIQDMNGRVATLSLTGSCLKERSDGVALKLAPLVDSICRPEDISVIARPADIAPLDCNVTAIQFVKS